MTRRERPLVYGHRGGHQGPPNTVEAVRRAIAAGADGVEIDIQLAADGALIAQHDLGVAGDGESVEDLAALLDAVHVHGALLLIDFKSAGDVDREARALSHALSDVPDPELVSVSSFSIPFLERFHELETRFELMPIVSLRQNFPRVGSLERWAGVSVLAAALVANPFLIRRLRRERRQLIVWFGATEWGLLLRIVRRLGADDVIVADVPEALAVFGRPSHGGAS